MNSQTGMKDWKKVYIREDGDFKKPRVARCTSDQEVLDRLSSVRWEHIKEGLLEAGMSKSDSLLPAIAYLAKHGWNDNLKGQIEAMNSQFRNVEARLVIERMEEQGRVGRSTVSLLIPAQIMASIRGSDDPAKTAYDWRERLDAFEKAERGVVRKRAMEALGEIGTPAALAELVKLLGCEYENIGMWAASVLGHAARERPGEVVPVLKKMLEGMAGRVQYEEQAEILTRICGSA